MPVSAGWRGRSSGRRGAGVIRQVCTPCRAGGCLFLTALLLTLRLLLLACFGRPHLAFSFLSLELFDEAPPCSLCRAVCSWRGRDVNGSFASLSTVSVAARPLALFEQDPEACVARGLCGMHEQGLGRRRMPPPPPRASSVKFGKGTTACGAAKSPSGRVSSRRVARDSRPQDGQQRRRRHARREAPRPYRLVRCARQRAREGDHQRVRHPGRARARRGAPFVRRGARPRLTAALRH